MTDSLTEPQRVDFTRFTVTVDRLTDGYRVKVDTDQDPGYAQVEASDLPTALRMALPYMESVAEPEPFAAMRDLFGGSE